MTAAVFIDVQNDFVKGGALPYAYPVEPNHQYVVEFAQECRKRGYELYATCDTHEKTVYDGIGGAPKSGYLTTLEGKRLPVEHCIEKTEGHRLIEGLVKCDPLCSGGNRQCILDIGVKDINIRQHNIIDKHTFGSEELVRKMRSDFAPRGCSIGIGEPLDRILICGYCTSICVVSNALMLRAAFHDTPIICMPDLCGDINEQSHFAALMVMQNCQIDIIPSIDLPSAS